MRLADMAMDLPYSDCTASGDSRPRSIRRARSMADSVGAYRGCS